MYEDLSEEVDVLIRVYEKCVGVWCGYVSFFFCGNMSVFWIRVLVTQIGVLSFFFMNYNILYCSLFDVVRELVFLLF